MAKVLPFDGKTYVPSRDGERLTPQFEAVRDIMFDGEWHTIFSMTKSLKAEGVAASDQAVSARIRDLRKPKFGGYTVERRYIGDGLWEYRVVNPPVPSVGAQQEATA